MTKKKYVLTDEHRTQLKPWADKWIANAMSTKPMDENDREQMRIAVRGLYEAANLTPPPDHRIIFVPSPFVVRFAGGFAASIWRKRKNATDAATRDATAAATAAATDDATAAATYDATYAATAAATAAATRDATRDATDAATYVATAAATDDATAAATRDATDAATYAATDAATYAATYAATLNKKWYSSSEGFVNAGINLKVGKFGFSCAAESRRMYQGGNFWSGWTAFLSFFRHVAKLDLDYSKYDHWEKATVHGSYRIMHPEFCMISDRPRVLKVDEQNRPHCEDGPFCQWSDGMSLYSWHGVRVPEYWIMQKHLLTADVVLNWENAEARRAGFEIIGWNNMLDLLNAKVIDADEDPMVGTLYEADHEALGGKCKFLKVVCGTLPPEMKTALQSNAWSYGLEDWQYRKLEVRT